MKSNRGKRTISFNDVNQATERSCYDGAFGRDIHDQRIWGLVRCLFAIEIEPFVDFALTRKFVCSSMLNEPYLGRRND